MDELARFGRPMRMDLKPKKPILAPTGPKTCATSARTPIARIVAAEIQTSA